MATGIKHLWLSATYYGIIVIVLRFLFRYGYRVLLHPLRKYPGPFIASVTDWYGAYYALKKSLHVVTYEDHRKYGPIVRQGPNKLVFNSATALRDIYRNDKLFKARGYIATQDDPEIPSIFSAIDKRIHRTKKKIISSGLSEAQLRRFEPLMLSHIDIFIRHLLDASQTGEIVDMTSRCKYVGLDISSHFGFGIPLNLQTDEKNRFLVKGMQAAAYRTYVYMQYLTAKYLGVELLLIRPLYAIRKLYREALHSLVARRMEMEIHAQDDLISFVVDTKDPETGTVMTEKEVFAEAEVFLIAGGLTTSSAITALFFYLSRNPSSYARLTSEIRSKFNEASEIVTSPTLSSCTYLRACINETLRMSPPAPGTLWRELPSNSPETHVVIDGHIVPRGTLVGVNTYTIHHNETYFKDPFEFEPERWLMYEKGSEQDNADFKLQQEAFQPFSLGTRACVGKVMANMEMSLLVARTLWYLDFERAGGTGIDKEGENTLVGEARGRLGGREKEFEIFDQLVTSHNGPLLRFRPTGNK